MKEIEEEEKAQVIRLGDASVASPFTSKLSTVMSGNCGVSEHMYVYCVCVCLCERERKSKQCLFAKLRRTYPCGNVKSNCNFVFHNGERKEIM